MGKESVPCRRMWEIRNSTMSHDAWPFAVMQFQNNKLSLLLRTSERSSLVSLSAKASLLSAALYHPKSHADDRGLECLDPHHQCSLSSPQTVPGEAGKATEADTSQPHLYLEKQSRSVQVISRVAVRRQTLLLSRVISSRTSLIKRW